MAKAGRPKGAHDISPIIRGAFIRALKIREDKKGKKSLSEIMSELLDDNPVGLLNVLKGYVPKEIDITATDLTHEEWLDKMDAESAED